MTTVPTGADIAALIGEDRYAKWQEAAQIIENRYEMETLWGGGKKWAYEYKYRKGGKTLCGLYAKPDCAGLMIIFGEKEREKFEQIRSELCQQVQAEYDMAETYHDGKWVMFSLEESILKDLEKLLAIKRKPNKKP